MLVFSRWIAIWGGCCLGRVNVDLLRSSLLISPPGPTLGRLRLIAKDQVKVVLVARAGSARLGTLITCRFCLVALGIVSVELSQFCDGGNEDEEARD